MSPKRETNFTGLQLPTFTPDVTLNGFPTLIPSVTLDSPPTFYLPDGAATLDAQPSPTETTNAGGSMTLWVLIALMILASGVFTAITRHNGRASKPD